MYFPLTIDNKRTFTKDNGVDVVDLPEQNFTHGDYQFSIFDAFYCPKRSEMRVDLLANQIYGNASKSDIVLKYNRLSNPFSVEQGDFIVAVDAEYARKNFKKENRVEELNKKIRQQFIDPTKKPETSESLTRFRSRELSVPPNISDGSKAVKVEHGKVTLGENVSRPSKLRDEKVKERSKFDDIITDLKRKTVAKPVKSKLKAKKPNTLASEQKTRMDAKDDHSKPIRKKVKPPTEKPTIKRKKGHTVEKPITIKPRPIVTTKKPSTPDKTNDAR